MGASHLGQRAEAGSDLVKKLRAGGDCTTRTADKVNAFIDAWPNVPPYKRRVASERRRSQSNAARP
ncbi:hypothetical protein [Phreatobacter oligotrophus]|nr:hypothetical protein [Phreatobacter oligotrophus]